MLKTEEKLRNYYKKAKLWIPPDSNFRHFRIFKFNGKVIKVKDRISNEEKLRRMLVREVPAHIYYSTSTFLNPTIIGKRSEEKIYENCYLNSELYFDIDDENLENAKERIIKLYDLIKEMGYKDLHVVFSGGRGFHLYVYDFNIDKEIENPIEKEKYTMEYKKRIAEEINKKVEIDTVITWDTRRIIRLPYTVHGKTGYLVEFVNIKKIHNFIPKLALVL